MLDSCFRSDGQPYGRNNSQWNDANIPLAELEWLEGDLKANDKPVIVFAHQRLDVSNNHGVKNNADVRTIIESMMKSGSDPNYMPNLFSDLPHNGCYGIPSNKSRFAETSNFVGAIVIARKVNVAAQFFDRV